MPWLVMVQEQLFSRPDLDMQDKVLSLVLFQVQGVNLISLWRRK